MEPLNDHLLLNVAPQILSALVIVLVITAVAVSLYRRKQRSLRQPALAQEIVEMQEHTFRTVSQEIHDNVGQTLSLVKLQLNLLSFDVEAPPQVIEIKELVGKAITALRQLCNGYYSEKLAAMGLPAAVYNLITYLEETGLFTIRYQSEIDNMVFSEEKTIYLYRMVQESLNNVVKHARASEIKVLLKKEGHKVHVEISDNGVGLPPGDLFNNGIGLRSIRQRAQMIGAELRVESEPNKGTTVHITCNPA